MQTSIEKKKAKAEERLVKIVNDKINPIRSEIAMYDKMLAAISEHSPKRESMSENGQDVGQTGQSAVVIIHSGEPEDQDVAPGGSQDQAPLPKFIRGMQEKA